MNIDCLIHEKKNCGLHELKDDNQDYRKKIIIMVFYILRIFDLII